MPPCAKRERSKATREVLPAILRPAYGQVNAEGFLRESLGGGDNTPSQNKRS
jgi:hypothetical protein